MDQRLSESRNRIIDAAREQFNQHGYRGVTMTGLAGYLGMSKRTVYQHFTNKEALAEAVLESVVGKTSARVTQIRSESTTVPPDVLFKRIVMQVKEELLALHSQFLADIQRYVPEVWQKFQQTREQKILNLEGLIQQGQVRGRMKPIPSRLAVLMFLGSVQAVIRPDVLMRESFSLSTAIDGVVEVFLNGLLIDDSGQSHEGM